MKAARALSILVLACAVAVTPTAASGQSRASDSVLGIDKLKHFLIAGFVESVTFAGLQAAGVERNAALGGAGATTAIVSIGREYQGRRASGVFSLGDLLWDALGAGAALLILTRVQR